MPLAALGINTALFAMVLVFLTFLAYATTPRIARAVGAGDHAEASRVVTQVVLLAIGLGLAAMVALQLLAEPLLALFGASDEVHLEARAYLAGGCPPGPPC